MATVRTPRRVLKLTRYLESILESHTASSSLKMKAAERLTEIFIAGEQSKERAALALARAQARAREAEASVQSPDIQQPSTADPDAEKQSEAEQAKQAKADMTEYLSKFTKEKQVRAQLS